MSVKKTSGHIVESTGAPAQGGMADGDDCGFCLYMRAGPCGTQFKQWEKCVQVHQDKGEDFARACIKVTQQLTACMNNNRDYYDLPTLSNTQENPSSAAANSSSS